MFTLFWDTDGVILVDVMARGETINSDAYIKTLQKLKLCYRRVRPNHGNADSARQCPPSHKFTKPRGNRQIWLECALHPPNSPDLAPSDFYVFGSLKDALRGTRFKDD